VVRSTDGIVCSMRMHADVDLEGYRACLNDCHEFSSNLTLLTVDPESPDWEATEHCYKNCRIHEFSLVSSGVAIFLVFAFALAFGGMTVLGSRLLEISIVFSWVGAAFLAIGVLVLGLLPTSTTYPMLCSEVQWSGDFAIFPITFLGASGSLSGLVVASV